MDIQKYYGETSKISYYSSWVSLIIAFIFLALHITKIITGNVLFITLPFLTFSGLFFWKHKISEGRKRIVPSIQSLEIENLFEENNILLAFMPAPSLRILLFSPNGNLLGELRDQNMSSIMWFVPTPISILFSKKYGLYDTKGAILATYKLNWGLASHVTIKDSDGNLVGVYKESTKDSMFKLKGMIFNSDYLPWIPVNVSGLLIEFQLFDITDKKIASFQKGWMPIEWGTRFKEMNTPILMFHELASMEDKIAVLGFCASAFHDHKN